MNSKYTVCNNKNGLVISKEDKINVEDYMVDTLFEAVYHLFVNSSFGSEKDENLLGEFDGFKVTIENYRGKGVWLVVRVECPVTGTSDAIVILQSLVPEDWEKVIVFQRREDGVVNHMVISIMCLMGLLSGN